MIFGKKDKIAHFADAIIASRKPKNSTGRGKNLELIRKFGAWY